MPTSTEIKQLFGSLRPALKRGRAELATAADSLRGMISVLDALDSINGDILAAADDAALADALAAARPKVRDVAGYEFTVTETVLVGGIEVEEETVREVLGFLDNAQALCQRIASMDTPELRGGIAAALAATE